MVSNALFFFCLGIHKWQEYIEHGEDLEIDSALRRTSRNTDEEHNYRNESFPLGEGVLTRNLGLDIVVVVTKVSPLIWHIPIQPQNRTARFRPKDL